MTSEDLYEDLKSYLTLKLQKPFNRSNIVSLVATGIRFADKFGYLTEDEIRDMVLSAIRDVVKSTNNIDDQDKQLILDLVDLLGSGIVDQLIDFGRDTTTFLRNNVFKCCKKQRSHVSSFERAVEGKLGHTVEELNKLREYLELRLQRPFNAAKMLGMIASGVKFIESYEQLSGVEKKNLVIHAIRESISSSTRISDQEKEDVLLLVDLVADDYIDLLVTFGRDSVTMFKRKTGNCCFKCK